jgi:hypothetical protein
MDEQDLLRKVQALLKKAEGTDNANEAETFFAKANELMVKYAIDEETVRAEMRRAGKGVEEPVVENFMFSSYAHHAKAKEALFVAVAKSQAVRTFPYGNQKHSNDYLVEAAGLTGLYESQWVRVIGYKSDIEHAKLLYVSLLIQSQKAANADWRERYGDAKKTDDWPQIGKFTWLSSHMDGFSERIAERFRESKEYVMAEANANALMIDKDVNIQEWMYEHGWASRPQPRIYYCWKLQPADDPGWPRNRDGSPSKKHRALYCIIQNPDGATPHEGPHAYTYDTGPYKRSYYVAKGGGRQESYEGKQAGRRAAERADVGSTKMGSGAARIGGG